MSEKDSQSEMDTESDSETQSEEAEEWYKEVNDVDTIREIVEPLKIDKYGDFLKWLKSCFDDEANEIDDILFEGKIPDWHQPIKSAKEVEDMIAPVPLQCGSEFSFVSYWLKKRASAISHDAGIDENTKIIPNSLKREKLMQMKEIVSVLNFLKLVPSKEGEYEISKLDKKNVQFWKIPSDWTVNELGAKVKFLQAMGKTTVDSGGNTRIGRERNINLCLKWLKIDDSRNENFLGTPLQPEKNDLKSLIGNLEICNFLQFLDLQPPSEEVDNWKIPSNMSVEALDAKADFIENIFFRNYPLQKLEEFNRPLVGNFKKRQKLINYERCKECNHLFKCLLQHLKKNQSCSQTYDDEDMKDLKKASMNVAKEKRKKYDEAHKTTLIIQKAEHYQSNKIKRLKQMSEYNKNNKAKNSMKMAEYYLKNKEKIAKRRAEKYQENREMILEKKKENSKQRRKTAGKAYR